MSRIRILLGVLLILTATLGAQNSQWEHFSYGEYVLSLATQGSTLLVATQTGLVKYDLFTQQKQILNKTNSPLPDNWISAVAISSTGVFWVGTPLGICRVEGDEWQLFNTSNSILPSNLITKIEVAANGTVWALSSGNELYDYLYRYDGALWTVMYNGNSTIPATRIQDIALDASGNPGIVYYNSPNDITGLAVWNGTTWINYPGATLGVTSNYLSLVTHDGTRFWVADFDRIYSWDGSSGSTIEIEPPPDVYPAIYSLGIDAQGHLLVAYTNLTNSLYDTYLGVFNGSQWQTINPNVQVPGLVWVNDIATDESGNIWLGASGGVAVYDGADWEDLVCSNSPLTTNSIKYLAVDSQDKVWLTFDDFQWQLKGLTRIDGENWSFFDEDDITGLQQPDFLAPAPDGSIWIETSHNYENGTLVHFDGVNSEFYNHSNSPLPDGLVQAMEVDAQNKLWLAIWVNEAPYITHFLSFDGSVWQTLGSTSNFVRDLALDAQGMPWAATDDGLLHYTGTEWEVFTPDNSGLPISYLNCLEFDSSGNLWIGYMNGLARLSTTGEWQCWDHEHGNQPYRSFNDLAFDGWGRLWGATEYSGLVCFDGENWTSYTTQNSPLVTDFIRQIGIDSQNYLWLNSQWQGITRLELSSSGITGGTQIPQPVNLQLGNYPNPFNPSTTLRFNLPQAANVQLGIYNIRGQLVRTLLQEAKSSGEHSLVFDGKDDAGKPLASGLYYMRISAGPHSSTRKIMLLK